VKHLAKTKLVLDQMNKQIESGIADANRNIHREHGDALSAKGHCLSYHYRKYANKEQQATPWTNAKIVELENENDRRQNISGHKILTPWGQSSEVATQNDQP
jgi:hypothetical protein